MTYFVTGGTGSFGKAFVRYILDHTDDRVVVFSRDELKQWEMAKTVDRSRCYFVIGDVRDPAAVEYAIRNIRDAMVRIVHAAALKHVHTGEIQPLEAIKTNVIGTLNMVRAANAARADMVLLSSDKAVKPTNLYGATKMTAEHLVTTAAHRVVRYGNVWGSRGSILHIFQREAEKGHTFTITDNRMTRFIVTLDEAVQTVLRAFDAPEGSITLPETIRRIRIVDLALAFDINANFIEIGVQPGEKLAEELADGITSDQGPFMTIDEIRELIDATV